MEPFDFCAVYHILRQGRKGSVKCSQPDFLRSMFSSCLDEDAYDNYVIDKGAASRYINGIQPIKNDLLNYCMMHPKYFQEDLQTFILPTLLNVAVTMKELYNLLENDENITSNCKESVLQKYPGDNAANYLDFFTDLMLLLFSLPFHERTSKFSTEISESEPTSEAIEIEQEVAVSPTGFLYDGDVPPSPCIHFGGREKELDQIHEAFSHCTTVSLSGMAGMGKSEVAKAYCQIYADDYTNIIYLYYTGDLKRDIAELDFVGDDPNATLEQRYKNHNRVIRSLKADSLLVVDNFNVIPTEDKHYDSLLAYPCSLLLTTRSMLEQIHTIEIHQLKQPEAVVRCFYDDWEKHQVVVEKLAETVHGHTYAMELIGKLLQRGFWEPGQLLQELTEDKVVRNATDQVNGTKDGITMRDTYYAHLHTLFGLGKLSDAHKRILCALAFMPTKGIDSRRFAKWIILPNFTLLDELIQRGFITAQTDKTLSLQPMLEEIIFADLVPSVAKCKGLCHQLANECIQYGNGNIPRKLIFSIVEKIITKAYNDNTKVYIRFLIECIPAMLDLEYEDGAAMAIAKLEYCLADKRVGTNANRALLLSFQADMEPTFKKAMALQKKAIRKLGIITEHTALLASNLYTNLGGLYRENKQSDKAKKCVRKALKITERYPNLPGYDRIMQNINYCHILIEEGSLEEARGRLTSLQEFVKTAAGVDSPIYADVMLALGTCCEAQGDMLHASIYTQLGEYGYRKYMEIK